MKLVEGSIEGSRFRWLDIFDSDDPDPDRDPPLGRIAWLDVGTDEQAIEIRAVAFHPDLLTDRTRRRAARAALYAGFQALAIREGWATDDDPYEFRRDRRFRWGRVRGLRTADAAVEEMAALLAREHETRTRSRPSTAERRARGTLDAVSPTEEAST